MSGRKASLVFVGAATVDAIALVGEFPGSDSRVVAQAVEFAGGGPAATAAVACARLGLATSFVGAVGDDEEGERIRVALAAERVDVSGLRTVPAHRSGATVVVVHGDKATRAISTRPVPPLALSAQAIELVREADWVHVDHLGWGPVSAALAASDGARPCLSVDAGNPIEGFALTGVDLYVPTVEALRHQFGPGSVEHLLDAALQQGAKTVVATNGEAGSVAADASGERVAVPGLPARVVSTLGAGDAFHGALLAAKVRGYSLEGCLAYANAVAALSCQGLDGRSAIPEHEVAEAAAARLLTTDHPNSWELT